MIIFCLFPLNYLALNLAIVIRNIKQQSQVYFHSAIINRYLWIKLDCRHWLRGNNLPFLWRQVCHNSDSVLCGLQLTFVCHSFFRLQTTSLPNFLFIQIPHRLSPLSHPTPNIPSAAVRLWLQRCARRVSSAGELPHIRALSSLYFVQCCCYWSRHASPVWWNNSRVLLPTLSNDNSAPTPSNKKRKRKARTKKMLPSWLVLVLWKGKMKMRRERKKWKRKSNRKIKGKGKGKKRKEENKKKTITKEKREENERN